jgi:hypothetical protein
MKSNFTFDDIKLTEQLALENYQQRNGVVDYRLPGVCHHYFPKYDSKGERVGEICLTCKVTKTVKGQIRYTFDVDGKRVAHKNIWWMMDKLGANDQWRANTYRDLPM